MSLSPESGTDFMALEVSTVLRFDAYTTRQCLNIQIINDEMLEYSEAFVVSLEKSIGLSNKFNLEQTELIIAITDDDGNYDVLIT